MKKLILIVIVVLVASTANLFAQEKEKESSYRPHVLFSTTWLAKYIGRNGVIFHDEDVMNSSLAVTLPKGFYLNLFHSVGFDDSNLNSNFADEIDYTLGWSGEVKTVHVNAGISYFDVFKIGSSKGDIIQPYLYLSKTWKFGQNSITPIIQLDTFLPVKSKVLKEGLLIKAGISYSYPIFKQLSINLSMNIRYDNGAIAFQKAWLLQNSANLKWSINKWSSVEVGAHHQLLLSQASDRKRNTVNPSISLHINF